MFYYWQKSGGEEAWEVILADGRDTLIAEESPRFITVLALSAVIDGSMSPADLAQIRYQGPLYFDFDGTDLDDVIPQFKKFLDKLQGLGINLRSLELFATGGRGFHVLIPTQVFFPKFPKAGVQFLPAIYKEMAHELFVDTLDMRVYTARRGRMFRVENSLRENGAYKVPITVDEAINITPENYKFLCSAPRVPPTPDLPVQSQKLAVVYATAEQKVTAAAKKKKDNTKDRELLARFKGQFPPTLMKIMEGGPVADGTGFHQLAMQIAITCNALGKSEAQMLTACEGLIQNHQSDGSRYNSPTKRKAELSRMFHYTADNVCYSYSKGALKSIAPAGTSTADLDGLDATAGAVLCEDEDGDEHGYLSGVFLTEMGVFRKTESGVSKITPLAFTDVISLTDPSTEKTVGWDVELLLDGKSKGRKLLDQTMFQSRTAFQKFAGQYNGSTTGTDNHVVAIQKLLDKMSQSNKSNSYLCIREGFDLLDNPESPEPLLDRCWVAPGKVLTDSSVTWVHRGDPQHSGKFHSDVMEAPDLTGSEEEAQVIEHLMQINSPFVVGTMLGWLTSCFQRQVYHHIYKQFPLLQVFGQAGAGKTKTLEAMLPLFYYRSDPLVTDAVQNTPYAYSMLLHSSASIPAVLDEFKPRAMKFNNHNNYLSLFRGAYTRGTYAKGGGGTDLGSNVRDIRTYCLSGPVLFMGEGLESETAVVERSVIVPFKKSELYGRSKHYSAAVAGRYTISSLGKLLVQATFELKFDDFKDLVDANTVEVKATAPDPEAHRENYNHAVILTGLDFLGQVLATKFQDRFADRLKELRDASGIRSAAVPVKAVPEAAKVLNTLALISSTEEYGSEFALEIGKDYWFIESEPGTIDLKMRNVYVKYIAWCKRKGVGILYDTESAFIHGLGNYTACIDRACLNDGQLKSTGTEIVFRFSNEIAAKDGVEEIARPLGKKK